MASYLHALAGALASSSPRIPPTTRSCPVQQALRKMRRDVAMRTGSGDASSTHRDAGEGLRRRHRVDVDTKAIRPRELITPRPTAVGCATGMARLEALLGAKVAVRILSPRPSCARPSGDGPGTGSRKLI